MSQQQATGRDWDARTYDRVANPHEAWAQRLLALLPLHGDERVLDAGCGSGRITRLLVERLPAGRVYGVDLSPAMLAVATEQLGTYGDRVCLLQDDLLTVRLPQPVDAVFSNATFHWIKDHAALFRNLAAQLRPGGMLVAGCGGGHNIVRLRAVTEQVLARAPFSRWRQGFHDPWNYAGVEETRRLLAASGFEVVDVWIEEAPERLPDRERFITFLRTVVLRPYLDALPPELQEPFLAAVADEDERQAAARTVDYVRLNMHALKQRA